MLNRRWRRTPAMVVLLLVTSSLLTSGCGGKQKSLEDMARNDGEKLEKIVEEVVTDPERAVQAKERLVRFERLVGGFYDEMQKVRTQAFYFNANYATSRDEYDRFLAELSSIRESKMNEIIELAMDIRSVVTRDEWNVLHQRLREELTIYQFEEEG